MAAMQIVTTLVLLCLLGASEAQVSNVSDLDIALAEMKGGSYYGFVMLLQLLVKSGSPIPTGDVTFLIPSDKLLADHTSLAFNDLPDFLLRHSIHQNLKFNNLQHFPTGSLIPSSLPYYMLSISNHGRRNFSLNNAQIVSPNVCRASLSIACHGISEVLISNNSTPTPPPHPSPSPSPVPKAPYSPPPPPPSAPEPAIPAAQPAPAPAPSPSSNEATPSAYTSVLLLFICSIVALAHP